MVGGQTWSECCQRSPPGLSFLSMSWRPRYYWLIVHLFSTHRVLNLLENYYFYWRKIGRMGLGSNPLNIRPIMQLGIFKRRLEVNNIGMQLFIVENKNSKVLRHYFPRTFCERWIKWSEVRPHRISDHNIQHSIPTFSFQISGRPIHVSQNKFLLHQSINQ